MSAGFVKAITKFLMGKEVEIYQGSEHDKILYSDSERSRKSVIHGTLVDAIDECLVIEVNGSRAYINSWTVQAILEPNSGISILDIYLPDERKLNK